MPTLLADSNFLQKSALSQYFTASKSNRIAIAEEVLVEMHKREPAYTIKKNFFIARGFPDQVFILRGVTSIYGLPISSARDARKLIDQQQTESFANWYDEVTQQSDGEQMSGVLGVASRQAQSQIEEIAKAVKHIQPIFRKINKRFHDDELKFLRKRVPYSHDLQRKLLEIMYDISRMLFLNTNVCHNKFPKLNHHTFRYFIFRYAMCMTLLYTRWVHRGNLSDDTNKLVNHVMDMHLAALGTFFGGILSDDKLLIDVHREARWLLRTSGVAFVG